jgi:drug/metabolite transporter (DMT)-like permease
MTRRTEYLLLLHTIVLIFGFTGILGQEISLKADVLVLYRMIVACAAIGIYMVFRKKSFSIGLRQMRAYALVGLIIAAHWITFFGAIKMANVSIAVTCMATTALFVSIWEPLLRKKKFVRYEAMLGLCVVGGIALIFSFEPGYSLGIAVALISAALAALFSVFNARLLSADEPVRISFYEMLFGLLGVTGYVFFSGSTSPDGFMPQGYDVLYLVLLGTVATAFAFVAGITVMRELSPYTVALSINLEPLYTIIIALILYGEKELMSPQFYLGGAIILATLLVNAVLKKRDRKRQEIIQPVD